MDGDERTVEMRCINIEAGNDAHGTKLDYAPSKKWKRKVRISVYMSHVPKLSCFKIRYKCTEKTFEGGRMQKMRLRLMTMMGRMICGWMDGYMRGRGGGAYPWPSRMKDLRPLPRPVELALPPRAMVIAESTALLPPVTNVSKIYLDNSVEAGSYFRCDL